MERLKGIQWRDTLALLRPQHSPVPFKRVDRPLGEALLRDRGDGRPAGGGWPEVEQLEMGNTVTSLLGNGSGAGSGRAKRILRSLVIALAMCALAGVILLNLIWSLPRDGAFKDFGSFVASGRAASEGLNPYGVYPLTFHVTIGAVDVDSPNLNPPLSVLLFEGLARFEPIAAFKAWYVVSFALYVLVLLLLLRACPARATPLCIMWALSLAGFWHTLELGQIYMPLLLALTLAWLLLREGRNVPAGLLIGLLVAIKPNFVLWPLTLLLAGHVAVALCAFASALLLSLVPLLCYGPGVYFSWLKVLGYDTGVAMPTNSSLAGLAARMDVPWLGIVLGAALVVVVAVWSWRARPSLLSATGLALVVILLASPLTWSGYTLFLLPLLFAQRWSPALVVSAASLVLPVPVILSVSQLSQWHNVVFGSMYGWALLVLFFVLLKEDVLRHRPGQPMWWGGRQEEPPIADRSVVSNP